MENEINNEILTFQEHIFENNEIENNNQNENLFNLHNILDSNHMNNIVDSINDFNDKINDYRIIEHKILVKEETKNIKNHILVHLENQIEIIEQNFEKITHKQFDNVIDSNNNLEQFDYKSKLNNKLNELLGFSLEDYNKKSVKIEESINEICSKINNYFSELRNDIYNLHILNQKLNFISNYESEINKNDFFELVDAYESNIKNKLECQLKNIIKNKIESIHDLFNMLKLLQSQLYVKVVTKYSCGICLTNNVESYYNNCGHVICKSCGIKNRNNNICPFCKNESVLKNLFFI